MIVSRMSTGAGAKTISKILDERVLGSEHLNAKQVYKKGTGAKSLKTRA